MSSDPNLTSAERRIMTAKGELVDLREGLPDLDDPARGGGDDRTVRASFLRDLLVQAREPAADRMSRSLRLRGARISGPLDLEHLELTRPVMLQDCCFAEPVKLRQARAADVRLSGCHLPNLQAAQLEVRGNLILDGLTATSVNLHAARIGGSYRVSSRPPSRVKMAIVPSAPVTSSWNSCPAIPSVGQPRPSR
jgi:hypothetical protein